MKKIKAKALCKQIAVTINGSKVEKIGDGYETHRGDWGAKKSKNRRYLAVMVDCDEKGNAVSIGISAQIAHNTPILLAVRDIVEGMK
jgi:hypothetical protein